MVVTLTCLVLATRLRLSADLTSLFPSDREARALARFVRVFGGGDVALVLVRGADPVQVEGATHAATERLKTSARIAHVVDRVPLPKAVDPTLAWAWAGPAARDRLEAILSAMPERLRETRGLLLAPGAGAAAEATDWLARDPLRLAAVPWEGQTALASGVQATVDGAFVTNDGLARLVVLQPRDGAFVPGAATAFVQEVETHLAPVREAFPEVTLALAGGHATAAATESMLRRDLLVSSILSLGLASAAFLFLFRRGRALVALLPPLAMGTLWTTGFAALWPGGLSAVATAFAAVVVGVGVDTGVHVYAALLEARRLGLSPRESAQWARSHTWRPTLTAAGVAAAAFACLGLADVASLGQLGVLCAVGELTTAVAILAVTPELGAWLERGTVPCVSRPRWVDLVRVLTGTKRRAALVLVVAVLPVPMLLWVGGPPVSEVLVALRPADLVPLAVQRDIQERFGGGGGQWVVLSVDKDPEQARTRADRVTEALDPLAVRGVVVDALTTFAPSRTTQAERLRVRDKLDLPSLRPRLAEALEAEGFDLEACAPSLEAFTHPSQELHDSTGQDFVTARHLAQDSGETLVATYVRLPRDAQGEVLAAIGQGDANAMVTGYPFLERGLRRTLARDLPRVGLAALGAALVTLALGLRSVRGVVLAFVVLAVELLWVTMVMRVCGLSWHLYSALVLPVLVGITLDEVMFLLVGANRDKDVLVKQGPLVATTALTTAAGFGALMVCRFDGLRELGAVGALGAVLGLVAALAVVAAGLRVFDS